MDERTDSKYFDFYEHRKELLSYAAYKDYMGETFISLQVTPMENDLKKNFKPVFKEFSHANSIYEIPENHIYKKNSAFKKGNFLSNGMRDY